MPLPSVCAIRSLQLLVLCVSGSLLAETDRAKLLQQGEEAFAIGQHERASELYAQACPEQVSEERHPHTGLCLHDRAAVFFARGQYRQALALYEQANEIWQNLGEAFRAHRAVTLNNLGGLYQSLGRWSEAVSSFRQALALSQAQFGERHVLTASSLSRLGGALLSLGEFTDAQTVLERAAAIQQQGPPDNEEKIATLNNLALLWAQQGHYAQAEPYLREVIDMAQRTVGEQAPAYAAGLSNLAALYLMEGQHERALPMLRRARAIFETSLGPRHPRLAPTLTQEANVLLAERKPLAAEALLRRAVELLQPAAGPNSADLLNAQATLAIAYLRQGRADRAEPLLSAVLQTRRAMYRGPSRQVAVSLQSMAELRDHQHRTAEAKDFYRQAVAEYEQAVGQTDPELGYVLRAYAQFLKRTGGERAAAKQIAKRAKAILSFR